MYCSFCVFILSLFWLDVMLRNCSMSTLVNLIISIYIYWMIIISGVLYNKINYIFISPSLLVEKYTLHIKENLDPCLFSDLIFTPYQKLPVVPVPRFKFFHLVILDMLSFWQWLACQVSIVNKMIFVIV